MPEVVIIRSGCTDFDEQNRIQGSLEIPINSQGEKQIRQVVEQLAQMPLEIILADSSQPSLSTAEAIGEALDVKVLLSDDLRNLDQGLWQGLQVEDVRHKYPRVFKQWRESPETICPPQGELATQAIERIAKVLRKPLKKRDCFAIVASEPLATLIGWVVSEQKSELPDPSSCCSDQPRVRIFHCGTELSDAPLARFAEMEPIPQERPAVCLPSPNGNNGHSKEPHGRECRVSSVPPSNLDSWTGQVKQPKRGVPEGLWIRCPGCEATVFRKHVEQHLGVCPECDHHFYVSSRTRISQLLDEDSFEEWFADLLPLGSIRVRR